MSQEYIIWRLVFERVATLEELETHWSLDDVARANALLDMKNTYEAHEYNKMKAKNKHGNR